MELPKGPEMPWSLEKLDMCSQYEGSSIHLESFNWRADYEQVPVQDWPAGCSLLGWNYFLAQSILNLSMEKYTQFIGIGCFHYSFHSAPPPRKHLGSYLLKIFSHNLANSIMVINLLKGLMIKCRKVLLTQYKYKSRYFSVQLETVMLMLTWTWTKLSIKMNKD